MTGEQRSHRHHSTCSTQDTHHQSHTRAIFDKLSRFSLIILPSQRVPPTHFHCSSTCTTAFDSCPTTTSIRARSANGTCAFHSRDSFIISLPQPLHIKINQFCYESAFPHALTKPVFIVCSYFDRLLFPIKAASSLISLRTVAGPFFICRFPFKHFPTDRQST